MEKLFLIFACIALAIDVPDQFPDYKPATKLSKRIDDPYFHLNFWTQELISYFEQR